MGSSWLSLCKLSNIEKHFISTENLWKYHNEILCILHLDFTTFALSLSLPLLVCSLSVSLAFSLSVQGFLYGGRRELKRQQRKQDQHSLGLCAVGSPPKTRRLCVFFLLDHELKGYEPNFNKVTLAPIFIKDWRGQGQTRDTSKHSGQRR